MTAAGAITAMAGDCVTGPGAVTAGSIPTWNGTTGTSLAAGLTRSNLTDTTVPMVHGATTVGHCSQFNDTTGTVIDSGGTCGGGGAGGSVTLGVTAAGNTQGTATLVSSTFDTVTTTPPGTGIIVAASLMVAGSEIFLSNYGANPLAVYPPTGATISNAGTTLATNAAVMVSVGVTAQFVIASSTSLFTVP